MLKIFVLLWTKIGPSKNPKKEILPPPQKNTPIVPLCLKTEWDVDDAKRIAFEIRTELEKYATGENKQNKLFIPSTIIRTHR